MKKIIEKVKSFIFRITPRFELEDALAFLGTMIFIFAIIGFIATIRFLICLL